MRHTPNRSDAREAFKRGYEQGQQDARAGKSRQLCESPRGARPPVTKADDSAYYHGYKAGAEDSGAWQPAYRRYEEKHGETSPVKFLDRIERTMLTAVMPGQTFWVGRGTDFRPLDESDGRMVAVGQPRRTAYGDCSLDVRAEDGEQRAYSAPCGTYAWVEREDALTENGRRHRGIYADMASEGDYVLRRHRGRVYVDRVGRGGTHTTIGPTRGYADVREAVHELGRDAHVHGFETGAVFNDEGGQVGSHVGGRFETGGADTIEDVERYVSNQAVKDKSARLFSAVFPTGIGYADRKREKDGDYARCAFLSFDTLELTFEPDCPKALRQEIERDAKWFQERAGEEYEVSASGQTVLLGRRAKHSRNGKYFLDVKLEAGHHRNGARAESVGVPRRKGETTEVSAHGRTLRIKLVSPGNYHLKVDGEQRARWASTVAEVREDAAHFLDMGALPPPTGQHFMNPKRMRRAAKRTGSVSDVDERAVQQWMIDHLDEFYEPGTGEPDPTGLAEAAAAEFDLGEKWYKPESALWDWSINAFEGEYERNAGPGTTAHVDQVADKIWGLAYLVRTKRKPVRVYFRVDGREGSLRVDMKTLPVAPWEAIDGGRGFGTLAEALGHIKAWKRAAEQQDTLTPRLGLARNGDGDIFIEYGVAEHEKGWYPVVWENGQTITSWDPRGTDYDVALAQAALRAEEAAAHYIGDWNVRIEEQLDQLKARLHESYRDPVITRIDGKDAAILASKYGPGWIDSATSEDIRRVAVY